MPAQRSVLLVWTAVVLMATVARSAAWLVVCARANEIERRLENWARKASKPPSWARKRGPASAHASSYRSAAARR